MDRGYSTLPIALRCYHATSILALFYLEITGYFERKGLSWKLEVGSWKLEVGSWKLEILSVDIRFELTLLFIVVNAKLCFNHC